MDAIFKALNDPARRDLLDSLRQKDGQSLSELEAQLDMTRFGVMKHLKVLEDASLIVTRKKGRFKYHYLNALPLQEVIDRWIDPFLAKPAARAVIDLKSQLEGTARMPGTDTKPDFMMQTYIRCSQDALWDALTDPARMSDYHFMCPKVTEEEGVYTYHTPDGGTMLVARTLRTDPKSRIEATFEPKWEPGIPASKSVFLIAVEGPNCRLTVEHYDLAFPVVQGEGVADGWDRWASGLKTYLETGQSVRFNDMEAAQ
jgi:DNA-binding transcriptional ArsR family regulator/uncharacterized protein YndB with AHSA1/START domain